MLTLAELQAGNDATKARQAQRLIWGALPESSRRNFFEFRGRQACIERAMATPLPGAAGDAFTKGAISVAGKLVNRVVPTHFAVLQALKSPLLTMLEQATNEAKSAVDFDDEQQWQICYVFTANPKTMRQTLKSPNGLESIKADAERFCGDWSAAELNFVMLAVIEQLKRHVETTVKFAAELEASGDVSFFRDKKPKSERPADSAG